MRVFSKECFERPKSNYENSFTVIALELSQHQTNINVKFNTTINWLMQTSNHDELYLKITGER